MRVSGVTNANPGSRYCRRTVASSTFGARTASLAFVMPVMPLMLVMSALAAFGGCGRLAEHPLVVEAAEEVRGNARVADLLGKPVTCSTAVRGTANEIDGIASLQFNASGPQGAGVVVVEGKKTRGAWGVTHLELRPASGPALPLTADLEARVGVDTPAFDPSAAPTAPSRTPPPPGEIEITLPPGPPGQ